MMSEGPEDAGDRRGEGGETDGVNTDGGSREAVPAGPNEGDSAVVGPGIDRPAASAGLVVAGVAVAATLLPWTDAAPLVPTVGPLSSTPGAVFAVVAAVAFLLRRHDALPRRAGATAAGLASGGVLLTSLARFIGPATGGGSAPMVGAGLPIAAVAGVIGLGLAVADARSATGSRLLQMTRRTAVSFGLVVSAFVAIALLSAPFTVFDFDAFGRLVFNILLPGPAFVGVAVAFVLATDRGIGFFDVSLPGVRDMVWAAAGIVFLLVSLVVLQLATFAAELPSSGNAVAGLAVDAGPTAVLLLVPLSLLVTGPAEELFTRNVIQKYLYGSFSRPAAVVVASTVFASAHVFSYAGGDLVATFVSLLVVFALSLILGAIYERTGNIVVPAVIHGLYNALQFAVLYVAMISGELDPESMNVVLPPW